MNVANLFAFQKGFLAKTIDTNKPKFVSIYQKSEYANLIISDTFTDNIFLEAFNFECVDLDECGEKVHNCHEHMKCVNLPGSFQCLVPFEADKHQNKLACRGDECSKVKPVPGYQYYHDGLVDIDECQQSPCSSKAQQSLCTNTMGSYRCQAKCDAGYELAANNSSVCIDVDECSSNATICGNQRCRNLVGSYTCDCRAGYKLSLEHNNTCIDIDECQTNEGLCQAENQVCVNTVGSYRCGCALGLEHDNATGLLMIIIALPEIDSN